MNRKIGILLHRWHRRLGLFAGLFVLWLAGSGIALNHSADLGLDREQVSAPWVTGLYGLHATIPDQGFRSGRHWLLGSGEVTVLDGRPIPLPAPLGLVAVDELLFATNASTLVLFDAQGRQIDAVRGSDLPISAIRRIGGGKAVVVIADERDRRYSSRDGLTWTPYAGQVTWSVAAPLPAAVRASAAVLLRPQIPAERVLQDAHSGHILGPYGPFLVDAVGILFILLALSGLWMLQRHHFRRNPAQVHGHPRREP